jgi:hypothetical protein
MKRNLTIIDYKWLDDNCFLTTTKDYIDVDGETYHYETEYTPSLKKYVVRKCYEHEVMYLSNDEIKTYEELIKINDILRNNPKPLPYAHNQNKVTISQCGKEVTFNLTDKEMQGLRKSSVYTAQEKEMAMKATHGRVYNFSMYAFFDYEVSRAKCGRFHANFNYHDGDFSWFLN